MLESSHRIIINKTQKKNLKLSRLIVSDNIYIETLGLFCCRKNKVVIRMLHDFHCRGKETQIHKSLVMLNLSQY